MTGEEQDYKGEREGKDADGARESTGDGLRLVRHSPSPPNRFEETTLRDPSPPRTSTNDRSRSRHVARLVERAAARLLEPELPLLLMVPEVERRVDRLC